MGYIMTNNERKNWFKKMRELDLAAERAGGYVSLEKCDDVHYNYRAIVKYCKEKNIKPTELTEDELKMFIV